MDKMDLGALDSDQVSRRVALRRFGKAGLLATAGAGLLELVGVTDASAHTNKMRAFHHSPELTRQVVVPPQQSGAIPDACCTGYLDEHHCDGNCPPGYFCYACVGCGLNGFACLSCNGTPTCRYCD